MKRSYYIIIPAHSGTTIGEIEKAKRVFRKMRKEGKVSQESADVQIEFSDTNYKITAIFTNPVGQEICPRVLI